MTTTSQWRLSVEGFQDLFPVAAAPKAELGRYRLLSPTAGVRVSPLCLGAMSLGDQWTGYMGKKLNYESEAGGNFIDTANDYQDQQSEWIVGDWMKARSNRDDIVLATKYTTYYLNNKEGAYPGIGVNYRGTPYLAQATGNQSPEPGPPSTR
ncbi:putative aryl-alcohol dehydrogenase aad14 [Cryptotrichosporon argae]